jgi:uncharacterized membrane protein
MLAALMSFWPAFAASAVAIPVVIHLINRKRFKIVPWAAMKFLLAAQKQTRKRMRIEQLLLLLCRMLVLALILFAMISVLPWAENIWANMGLATLGTPKIRQQRTHHIFVLDCSLSMNQKVDGGQSAFETARQLALKKIADNSAGDGYSVLLLKDNPVWLVGEFSQDARKVGREIEAIKPTHGNASLSAALSMVSSKLSEAKSRFPVQAVYFFTDMQYSTWMSAAPTDVRTDTDDKEKNPYLDIKKHATTVFVDCGPRQDSGNLAVTNVEFDLSAKAYVTVGEEFTVRATVMNYGKEPKAKVRPELLIGKAKEVAADTSMQLRVSDEVKEPKDIEAHSQQTFVFPKVKFDKPGTYAVQVKISEDALVEDNTRTIVITVRDAIPILLVNGKPAADRFERATEYLRLALNPFAPGTEPKHLPLRPKVVNPSQFSEMTETQLEEYECIFWCDGPPPGVNDLRKLDGHLRRGGGFIVSLGDRAAESIDLYNDLLHNDDPARPGKMILPAKLMRKVSAPPDHHFYLYNSDKDVFEEKQPLAAFSQEEHRMTLRTVRFQQFVEAVVPKGKARTLLSFMWEFVPGGKGKQDDTLPVNKPAIIEWNPPLSRAQQPAAVVVKGKKGDRQPARYRGRVILLTTAVNLDWSNWPLSYSFIPMMHELTRFATAGRLIEQSQSVGDMLEAYLPGNVEMDVTVRYPAEVDMKAGKTRTQVIEEVNLFRWPDTDVAGVYRAETSAGHEIPFAVNFPNSSSDQKWSESDLKRIDEDRLKDSYPGWVFQKVRDPLDVMFSGGPDIDPTIPVLQPVGPFLANVALLMVLALLFIEILLAWHFGHYTTTEGALAQAAPNPTGTIIAAVVAAIAVALFSFGAFILIWEKYTGDFLGFLPELVRGWFESAMGIAPPLAGEGRNWTLDPARWLFGMPGPEHWYAVFFSLAALTTIFFTYKAEAPRVSLGFKLLLGVLRLCLILTTIWFLLPRPQIQYAREGWPDVVILIDDTRSMGEPDTFRDAKVIERVKELSGGVRERLKIEIPEKIKAIEAEIQAKKEAADRDPEAKRDWKAVDDQLQQRLQYWQKQQGSLETNKWRPSRLQLVQAILSQDKPHWLKTLLQEKKSKVHIFHLDKMGTATKLRDGNGDAGELVDPFNVKEIERANAAINKLDPVGEDSRLGSAVRNVIDHYRGSGLSSVIMFTDGVTTRDETLAQVADYALSKQVSLYFIGVGDEHDLRDLRLQDLEVDDPIYLGDTAVFQVSLRGSGYKDLSLPVVLKLKSKDGVEKEVARETVKVDPSGRPIKIRLRHTPKQIGPQPYIIEVESPKVEDNEKPIPQSNLRLERTIEVIDTKMLKVLYVEGQPRYEFRYIKFLLERDRHDEKAKKKKKAIDLTVLLLDADEEWAARDRVDKKGTDMTAISIFPPTLEELNKYDVLILGDCDPDDKKLRGNLKNIVSYVRGENERGAKAAKPGGGLLFIAGALNNPHRYMKTPLAAVMPIEPLTNTPPPEVPREIRMRPELTPAGRLHPIFKFGPDEGENAMIWGRLAHMYWYSSKYGAKRGAEVLAVHPSDKAEFKDPNQSDKHPLVVHMNVGGTGRSMFFGFDETWRWRRGDDESKFETFWVQTMRYLARGRSTRTDLKLDRQTPYRVGDKIKVTVRFPDNSPGGGGGGNEQTGPKIDAKTKVKVTVIHTAPDGKVSENPENIELAKLEGSWGTYETTKDRTREGKYKFKLAEPDVRGSQPDGEQPSAEATVELPPGELDRLRMNQQEMEHAAYQTDGRFYTLANADQLLVDFQRGAGTPVSPNVPPTLLWNQWWVFGLIVLLITAEWVLRKLKHLL